MSSYDLQNFNKKQVYHSFQMRASNTLNDNPGKTLEFYSIDKNEQVQLKNVKISLKENSIEDHYNKQNLCRAGNTVLKELAKKHKVSKLSYRKNPWGHFSYRDMIRICLETKEDKRMQLNQIYDWIVDTVPYFRSKNSPTESTGWKNSIRHNLSLQTEFVKIPCKDDPRQSTWTIEECLSEEEKQLIIPSKRAECRQEQNDRNLALNPITAIEQYNVNPFQFDDSNSHNTLKPGYSSERANTKANRAVEKLYGKVPTNSYKSQCKSIPYSRPNRGSLSGAKETYSETISSGYSSFDKIDDYEHCQPHEQRRRVSSMPNWNFTDNKEIRPRFSTAFLQRNHLIEIKNPDHENSILELQIEEAIQNMDR